MTSVVQSFERQSYSCVQLSFTPMDEHSVFEMLVWSLSYLVQKIDEIVSRKLRPHYRSRSTANFTPDNMLKEPRNYLGTKAKKLSASSNYLKSRL